MSEDPYYLAENNIEAKVIDLIRLYQRWDSIISKTNSYTDKDFRIISRDIKKLLSIINQDLLDIEQVIDTIQKYPIRFNLSQDELKRRILFANTIKIKINKVNKGLNDPVILKKIQDDKKKAILESCRTNQTQKTSRFDSGLKSVHEKDNRDFVNDNQQYQQQLFQQQDEALNEMHNNILELENMGKEMNKELVSHGVVLDRLNERADNSSSLLQSVMGKLNRFMNIK